MAWLRTFVAVPAAAFLLITALTTEPAAAAEDTCVSKLNPCLPYVNDTTSSVPDTCCNPVKEAITKDSDCLCSYYNTPGMLDSLGIKPSRVTELMHDCKIDSADPATICKGSAPPADALFPEPPPASKAVAGSVAGVGVSSLFLLLATSVLY